MSQKWAKSEFWTCATKSRFWSIFTDSRSYCNMPGKIRHAKRSWTALDNKTSHFSTTLEPMSALLPMEWRFFKRILQVQMLCNKGKTTLLLRSQHGYNLFLSERPIFELSLDRSYFLGSFSLEMFLRMFLNFSNGNLITLKDQAKIIVFTLMNCTLITI